MIARAGIVLAVLQFAFALTWVVYAAYLPGLVAQVGLSKSLVPWILLADQAIFVVCDWLAGVFADRVGDAVVRLGRQIALVTLVSCAAFLALPFVAPAGSAPLLAVLMIVWSASSSILRAPPLALAGRHASRPQRAWLAGLYSLGLGGAGAVAPYLGRVLATTDPRIPFVATSCVVAAMAFVLSALPHERGVRTGHEPGQPRSLPAFALALALLAIGYQIHGSINSAVIYLRHAPREDLSHLLPVFWIGFNVASLLAVAVVRRAGGLVVMIGAGVVGAAALVIAELGDSLATVVAAQAFAGLAWGGMMVGAFTAATALDRRPGGATGLVFSMLAGATVVRIALVASGLTAAQGVADVAPWVAPVAWGLGALVVASFAFRRGDMNARRDGS